MPRLNVTRTFSLPNLLICGLSIFYAGSALSESKAERLPEFEDVYRIELIIFTNRNNLDAFNDNDDNNNSQVAEDWSAKPDLSYPENLVFLHPKPPALLTLENNDSALNITPPQREELVGSIPASELSSIKEDKQTAREKALATLPLLEHLDSETHLLKDMAKSIGRRSNHKVLFHQAWHQELGAADIAASIPISGGETFDNHRELEGSIKLNKDRYLHITSDLWLTQYVLRNDAQWDKFTAEPTENSLLTAKIIDVNHVPDFPLDLVRIAEDAAIREAALAKLIEDEALYEFTLEQDSESIRVARTPSEVYGDLTTSSIATVSDVVTTEADIELLVNDATELSFDLFEASKTYVLKEHRKMKRAEVHFLDHPMMGLIIQITKYEVPVNAENAKGS